MTQASATFRPCFWSDDFDMDLLKVIPAAEAILAGARAIRLVTHGGLTNGRLNHPCCWNGPSGLSAFFGVAGTDEKLWMPPGYVTNNPIVECNGEEALRDWWPHSYILYLNGQTVTPMADAWQGIFQKIMYHVRGWTPLPEPEFQDAIFDVEVFVRKQTLASFRQMFRIRRGIILHPQADGPCKQLVEFFFSHFSLPIFCIRPTASTRMFCTC